jgi:hypothetical protein
MKARLQEIARRLAGLAADAPAPPGPLARLTGPVRRWLFARPHIPTDNIKVLVRGLSAGETPASPESLAVDLQAALRELEHGVRAVERAAWATGRVPAGSVGWLWRLYQIVYRARQLVENPGDVWSRRALAATSAASLAPLCDPAAREPASPAAVAVDPVLEAAAQEFRRIGRKRRLLEAARQLLLEAAAAGTLDPRAARARREAISRQIARLDRLQAAGLSPEVDLLYQARQARARKDLPRLAAALGALEEAAIAAGQDDLGRLAERAAGKLWGAHDRRSTSAQAESLARSHQQLFGARTRERVEAGYQRALATLPALRESWKQELDEEFFLHLRRYLDERGTDATMAAATAADGCFELGAAVSPVRSLEINQRLVQVRHPTQDMTLVPARAVADLADAVIEDPRTVLTSLASGTLLTRRYLALETQVTERKGMRNEARFYMLDGSGSMIGPRARMRDALLVTELVTLAARLEDPQRAGNPVLYYSYFALEPGPVRRVATVHEAHEAIEDVIGTVRLGGTNIQRALLWGLEQIREAREKDPDLVRAQLVLLTDGEAEVDLPAIEHARAAVGDLPVGISMIALGQENADLRRMAAAQRAGGERVFYQFTDDTELTDIERGWTAGLPIHLPPEQGPAVLTAELDELLDEIDQEGRRQEVGEIEHTPALDAALAEVGLSPEEGMSEAARARREALNKDGVTLGRRFLRWFPRPAPAAPPSPLGPRDQEALEEIARLLATVAEVIDVGAARPLERRADAIEILERLLRDTALAPWRYVELVRKHPARLAAALERVHAAVEPGVTPEDGRDA